MQEVYAFFLDIGRRAAYWVMGNGTYQLLRLLVLSCVYHRLIFGSSSADQQDRNG